MRGESPLAGAVRAYQEKKRSRFHMPGHKGVPVFPVGEAAAWDITEVQGADSLYEASGPIRETEERFSRLYGSAGSFLSAGGSTLCIQAMLALACPPGSKVIAARGVHTAAVNAMALLDLHPVWVWPEQHGETGLMTPVTPDAVQRLLGDHRDAAAVYLTSPNYFGMLTDIAGISAACQEYGIPLLVDNAHGAHLNLLEPSRHPLALGADLCCDSLHKTLPVLTGGALLHVNQPRFLPHAKRMMALFGSTSPSYLIMLSADGLLPWLETEASGELARIAEKIQALEKTALERGFALPEGDRDPIRLTLGLGAEDCQAEKLGALVREYGIEPEYTGGRFCVFLAGPHNSGEDFCRLERLVREIPVRDALPRWEMEIVPPEAAVSIRQAVLGKSVPVPTEKAASRIAGGLVAPCPPGIPLAVPGERIDRALAEALKKSGISTVNVLE